MNTRKKLSAEDHAAMRGALEFDAALHAPFVVLLLTSCAIATFGLIANSAAVIIGAMIIAPLMNPLTALAFGAVNGIPRLVRAGAITLGAGILTSLVLSALISLVTGMQTYGSEILARSQPTLLDLGVALAAGVAAAYARIRTEVVSALAGTAIAVALMPPLCTIGIAMAHADGKLALGAGLLFASNIFGIIFACMIVFALGGFVEWKQARGGFVWATVLVVLVSIPLAAQFTRLAAQARIEGALRHALVSGTVTFERVELVKADFDWLDDPPQVRLLVRSPQPITSTQVRLLEQYATRATGQRFQLIFDVTRQERVLDQPSAGDTPQQP